MAVGVLRQRPNSQADYDDVTEEMFGQPPHAGREAPEGTDSPQPARAQGY